MEKKQHREACYRFLRGTACPEADEEQKALFVQEVCTMLPLLSGQYSVCVSVFVCVCVFACVLVSVCMCVFECVCVCVHVFL